MPWQLAAVMSINQYWYYYFTWLDLIEIDLNLVYPMVLDPTWNGETLIVELESAADIFNSWSKSTNNLVAMPFQEFKLWMQKQHSI